MLFQKLPPIRGSNNEQTNAENLETKTIEFNFSAGQATTVSNSSKTVNVSTKNEEKGKKVTFVDRIDENSKKQSQLEKEKVMKKIAYSLVMLKFFS